MGRVTDGDRVWFLVLSTGREVGPLTLAELMHMGALYALVGRGRWHA